MSITTKMKIQLRKKNCNNTFRLKNASKKIEYNQSSFLVLRTHCTCGLSKEELPPLTGHFLSSWVSNHFTYLLSKLGSEFKVFLSLDWLSTKTKELSLEYWPYFIINYPDVKIIIWDEMKINFPFHNYRQDKGIQQPKRGIMNLD